MPLNAEQKHEAQNGHAVGRREPLPADQDDVHNDGQVPVLRWRVHLVAVFANHADRHLLQVHKHMSRPQNQAAGSRQTCPPRSRITTLCMCPSGRSSAVHIKELLAAHILNCQAHSHLRHLY